MGNNWPSAHHERCGLRLAGEASLAAKTHRPFSCQQLVIKRQLPENSYVAIWISHLAQVVSFQLPILRWRVYCGWR